MDFIQSVMTALGRGAYQQPSSRGTWLIYGKKSVLFTNGIPVRALIERRDEHGLTVDTSPVLVTSGEPVANLIAWYRE